MKKIVIIQGVFSLFLLSACQTWYNCKNVNIISKAKFENYVSADVDLIVKKWPESTALYEVQLSSEVEQEITVTAKRGIYKKKKDKKKACRIKESYKV